MIRSLILLLALPSILFAQVPIFKEPRQAEFALVPNYTPSQQGRPNITMPSQSYIFSGTDHRTQVQMADRDIANHRRYIENQQRIFAEANIELNTENIFYEFPSKNIYSKEHYYYAFRELKKMLDGESVLDIKKAIYLVEHAYDTALQYADFKQQINKATSVIVLQMQKDKISSADNTGKIMTVFKYMADTIKVYSKALEKNITTYPKTYDFEDFWGRDKYNKMFVSKLIKEGNGQCHSLPLLFLILCQEIKAQASLAFAPNHSFVKFADKSGRWHNIELTNQMLASDQFMIQSGYIKAEALQSRIYLQPLSKKEEIVQCLNDLAMGYGKKFGNDQFILACTNLALKNQMNSLTAHQINANYYYDLSQFILNQYRAKGWNRKRLENDSKAMEIINAAVGATKHIDQLGYSDMPPEAYAAWLRSAQEQANKQRHLSELSILNGMIDKR